MRNRLATFVFGDGFSQLLRELGRFGLVVEMVKGEGDNHAVSGVDLVFRELIYDFVELLLSHGHNANASWFDSATGVRF